jgi:hypothetical protein
MGFDRGVAAAAAAAVRHVAHEDALVYALDAAERPAREHAVRDETLAAARAGGVAADDYPPVTPGVNARLNSAGALAVRAARSRCKKRTPARHRPPVRQRHRPNRGVALHENKHARASFCRVVTAARQPAWRFVPLRRHLPSSARGWTVHWRTHAPPLVPSPQRG